MVDDKNAPLIEFEWDSNESFFNVKTPETVEKKTVKEVKEDNPVNLDDENEPEVTKEDTFEEDDFFNADAKGDSTEFKQESFWKDAYKTLKEKGVLSVEITDDSEMDDEKVIQLLEEELDARFEESIEEFMDELDDDGKAFLKFKKEGGDTKEFFKIYSELSTVPIPKGDVKSDSRFLEYYYKTVENMDDEEIQDKLSWLEETGKLRNYAEKYYDKFEENQKAIAEAAIQKQEKMRLQQEEQRKQLVKDLKSEIDNSSEIKDWSITAKDKKELHGYMTKPVVKTGNQILTKFQDDLQKVFKDKQKMILLAKIISNDFDVTDIKQKAKTEVIRETRSTIESGKTTIKKGSGKALTDYF